MKTVKIPDCMSPFIVKVNGIEYVYPAGETVEVPDEVAHVIEQHQAYHDSIEKVNTGEANPGGGEAADVAFLDLKKTITEVRDDTTVNLPNCAFCGCTNLKMVVLPKVEKVVNQELFRDCPNLEVVDFTALTCIGNGSYYDESTWETIYDCPLVQNPNLKAVVNRGGLFIMGDIDNQVELDGMGTANCGIDWSNAHVYVPREYIKEENFVGVDDPDCGNDDFCSYPNGADWDYLWNQNRIRAIEDYTVDGTVTGALDLAKMGIE